MTRRRLRVRLGSLDGLRDETKSGESDLVFDSTGVLGPRDGLLAFAGSIAWAI